MTKDALYSLLEEMTPGTSFTDSSNDPAWFAHRRAEQLEDKRLLTLLCEIIEGRSKKAEKEIRRNAYFVMGRILSKTEEPVYCQFLVDCLRRETDRYVLAAMLDGIGRLRLSPEVNVEAIIECSQNPKWLVRHSAIHALRSSDTEVSREAVRYWVRQEDEKKYKYELIYAHEALGEIGTEADISLLERHIHSRIRDVRDTARCAIDTIQKNSIRRPEQIKKRP